MPTIVIASGSIDGEVRRNTVGTPPKDVAEFRVDTGDGWYTCVAWQDLAAKVPESGSVLVHGRLRTRSYDAKDGGKRYVTEIIASSVEQVGAPADDEDLSFD